MWGSFGEALSCAGSTGYSLSGTSRTAKAVNAGHPVMDQIRNPRGSALGSTTICPHHRRERKMSVGVKQKGSIWTEKIEVVRIISSRSALSFVW
jgi:hypothetical protein